MNIVARLFLQRCAISCSFSVKSLSRTLPGELRAESLKRFTGSALS